MLIWCVYFSHIMLFIIIIGYIGKIMMQGEGVGFCTCGRLDFPLLFWHGELVPSCQTFTMLYSIIAQLMLTVRFLWKIMETRDVLYVLIVAGRGTGNDTTAFSTWAGKEGGGTWARHTWELRGGKSNKGDLKEDWHQEKEEVIKSLMQLVN